MTKYTIYCDESEKDGKYYSDFYGGVLVKTTDVSNIEEDFSKFKCDNKFFREFSFKKDIAFLKLCLRIVLLYLLHKSNFSLTGAFWPFLIF